MVTSSQTTVQDGEEYKFTVVVRDDDLTTLPNIIEGETLTIELPEFLEIRMCCASILNGRHTTTRRATV